MNAAGHKPTCEDAYVRGFQDCVELHSHLIVAIQQLDEGLIDLDELKRCAAAVLKFDDPNLPAPRPNLAGPVIPIEFRDEP